ncbi:tRNA epoxyqueuosine(34) reductase QueG [Leptospira idonii]|uniref:tRNA epoxyqueuosine(34) reductase QueG n=1 Tax=Leptospira idonii TaxID=1193500 RepID=UPI003CCC652A
MSVELSRIKDICLSEGFDLVGFTPAVIPKQDIDNIQSWVDQQFFGKMDWFTKQISQEIRLEMRHLGFVPQSVIALGMVYRSEEAEEILEQSAVKVSRYALGDDYHQVLRNKGKNILKKLKQLYPQASFRQSIDSLPIPEKVFARLAGIGWMGKNTNIINEAFGSYFFLSMILTDYKWEIPEVAKVDHCGTCNACLDACPTGALFEPYKIDASKCISHHTIENREDDFSPTEFTANWLYGCDICQEVCPWNKNKAKRNRIQTTVKEFIPYKYWTENKNLMESPLSMEDFASIFRNSAVKRIGSKSWNRNLSSVLNHLIQEE